MVTIVFMRCLASLRHVEHSETSAVQSVKVKLTK
jgi:hypothetical protein